MKEQERCLGNLQNNLVLQQIQSSDNGIKKLLTLHYCKAKKIFNNTFFLKIRTGENGSVGKKIETLLKKKKCNMTSLVCLTLNDKKVRYPDIKIIKHCLKSLHCSPEECYTIKATML